MAKLVAQLPQAPLDAVETADLIHMIEEEKVARDVYSTLFEEWGHWIFDHIALSEQQHVDAVTALLERYDIPLPVSMALPGVYDSVEMQELYAALVEQGRVSLIDALYVGATIEDMDILDLRECIELTDNPDIETVYENLMRGSRNHLRSFVDQLTLYDIVYTAQYLTQEEVDAIVASEHETGLITTPGNNGQGNN
ncbi:MAG: hypothetical protein C0622_12040 [Desulfuromonas sp.]|nr:MAG: hypothetical protein C0622_12040 [Desulfuromonas sp.]